MGENLFHKPTMVSRLPKFGARPAGGTSPMLNGSGQSTPSVEGKVPPQGKINGMVHVSSLPALKRKTGGGTASVPMPRSEQDLEEQLVAMTREVKNAPATASQPRRTSPVPRGTPRGGRVHGTHSSKLKGSNGGPAPSRSSLRRLVPGPSLRQGLSRSSDSLKALSLDNMVRSQSFSHFKQLPSASPLPVSNSLSFSKGQARCKPVSGRPSPSTKDPAAAVGLAPPSVPKKALLPGKPSVLSYKLTRPSMVKHPRSSSRQGSRDSMVTPLTSPDPPSDLGGTPEESPGPSESEHIPQCPAEFPEDMSLSSTSSLEHVDTSEEYLDDFDNLGDVNGLLQVLPPPREGLLQSQPHALIDNTPPSRQESTPSQTSLHSLLSDGVDWAEMGLTGGDNDFGLPNCHNDQALSPDVGYPHGSSLDLSPSDSSGGTYMWDEEGLEPLGVPTHPCGSYDSDINSMDILNNLDNLESCDLEEDDLMLDVDLPEDCSLHSDADRSSCTEGPGDPGLWGRSGQGHASDRESMFPELDIYSALGVDQHAGGCVPRCTSPSDVEAEALWDLAQDCSTVKAQLLHLKGLLQSEAEDTIQEALQSDAQSQEPNKDSSAAFQVEALLREVQELREELRSKEETISLLTQQTSASVQAGGCTCRRRDSGERRSSSDKATQTPWTRSVPQILQPSGPRISKHLVQGALAGEASSLDPGDPCSFPPSDEGTPGSRPRSPLAPNAAADARSEPGLFQPCQLLELPPKTEEAGKSVSDSGVAVRSLVKSQADGRARTSSRHLGPARGMPASRLPTSGGARSIPGPHLRTKQLAAPSRGLSSFTLRPQTSGSTLPVATFGAPRLRGLGAGSGGRESECSLARAKGPTSSPHSRLPKPKIHQ